MTPDRIGKYEVLEEIGRGTMGTVYKAKDPTLNRAVAIKTMAATPGRNDESKQRFQREAQAAAHLSHPNIVTVHDLGEENGLIYMAMELLEGQDLRDVIDGQKLKTLDEKLHVMEQVAAGLAFAHSKGVVHRDLKPANIQIQPNGQVKIVDFGLARLGGSDLTQDDVVLGTPNYMSPEQALGDRVDSRTDIFSAGGVFYEMLVGKKPFDAETTPGVLYQVVHKEPVPVRKWAPEVPPIVAEVVDRCLAKDKSLRFQNGRQLRAALGVVRQAYEAGRLETATLAEESQRAHEDARKNDSQRLGAPSASRAPWTYGSAALEQAPTPSPEPRTAPSQRAPTLSGRASTEPAGRRRPGGDRPRAMPSAAGVAFLLVAAGAGYWYWRSPRGEEPVPGATTGAADPSRAEVGALTEALVESQIELALKNLEDKNWAGAISQAERALKLDPGSPRAQQVLDQARGRRKELDAAATEARRSFEAGNLEDASRALGRVLDLDPKHPVVGELTARLNSTFRSRAEEARRTTERARLEAERGGAQGTSDFSRAVALSAEGDVLFRKSEFADATQRYLEARDAFDRGRRTVTAPRAAPRSAGLPSADERTASAANAPAGGQASTGPAATSSPLPEPSLAPAPRRQFVTGKTIVATGKAGGGLTGFDTADVKTKKVPDLVGRLDFEVEPGHPQSGDYFGVRLYLVNEGKKAVRVKTVSFTAMADGKRANLPGTLREREVAPQGRVLVAETRGRWPDAVTSWSLEAAVISDRDESCTSRLTWQ